MSIIDRLQGRSGGRIQVYVDPQQAGPGTEMAVRFTIVDGLDDKARSVVAGITCTGRYEVEERDRDSDGDIVTRKVWREVEVYEHRQPVELRPGEQVLPVFLPDHVQPTSGDIVSWEAWARIDRAKGVDVVERVPFEVRVPIDRVPSTRQGDATDDGLTLRGIPTAVSQGDTLTGALAIDVPDEVKVRSVAVRLHRRVTFVAQAINDYDVYSGSLLASAVFGDTSRITREEQVAEVELGGKATFSPGQRHELPFSIVVPPAGPTSSHAFAQVDWRLEAVLDRRMWGDKSVETPLIVV
jgi:hypothetical protein